MLFIPVIVPMHEAARVNVPLAVPDTGEFPVELPLLEAVHVFPVALNVYMPTLEANAPWIIVKNRIPQDPCIVAVLHAAFALLNARVVSRRAQGLFMGTASS